MLSSIFATNSRMTGLVVDLFAGGGIRRDMDGPDKQFANINGKGVLRMRQGEKLRVCKRPCARRWMKFQPYRPLVMSKLIRAGSSGYNQ